MPGVAIDIAHTPASDAVTPGDRRLEIAIDVLCAYALIFDALPR
jgi:hypothetical protein